VSVTMAEQPSGSRGDRDAPPLWDEFRTIAHTLLLSRVSDAMRAESSRPLDLWKWDNGI